MIYFIQAGKNGPVKIGMTNGESVEDRLKQLQTSNHEKLKILCVFSGGQKEEIELHKKFEQFHIHGEWFQPSKEIMNEVFYRLKAGFDITDFKAIFSDIYKKSKERIDENKFNLQKTLADIEKEYIMVAISRTMGIQSIAADILGITKAGINQKIKRYNLQDFISGFKNHKKP